MGRATIVGTIGPPATLVMAWFVLGEVIQPIQIAGAALIAGGIVFEVGRSPTPLCRVQDKPA